MEKAMCWVCDREKSIKEDMVYVADSYICNTQECLVEAVEQLYQSQNSLLGRMQACK